MHILAHRAFTHGPSTEAENTVSAIRECLSRGWGLEIDIRRQSTGDFYLSHDRLPGAGSERDAAGWCAALREHPDAIVALNVKELGYERELVEFLEREKVLRQSFLFDMELIEPQPGETARKFRQASANALIAARVSDRGESIDRALAIPEATVIWLDEFDGPWATAEDCRRLSASGRQIFVVSPELHAGTEAAMLDRWRQLCQWPIDGICTDYPARLERFLAGQTT